MEPTKILCYPIVKKSVSPLAICLGSLYNDELTQNLVRTVVGEQFDALFNQYVNDAVKKRIKVRTMFEKRLTMKSLFVEFGFPLESVEDLLELSAIADQFDILPKELSYFDCKSMELKTIKIKTDFADPNGKPKRPTTLQSDNSGTDCENSERLVDIDNGCDVVDA